jgi:hypothetical protein
MSGGIYVAHGNPQTIWVPITDATTIYVGGLATVDTSGPGEGIIMLPDASGVANVSNEDMPMYVVIGTNRKTPLYDSTYKCEYITSPASADPHDGASIEYFGVEGSYSLGDPIAMAKVACIDHTTVLSAPIFNAAVGTPPTEVAVTVRSADGLGCTTDAIDFTGIAAPFQTFYFRSGGNAGTLRMSETAHATVHTWGTATVADIEVGDKVVAVPCRTHGPSTVMFDGTSASFVDAADAPVANGTDRWAINVRRLNLKTANEERVEFNFDAGHFGMYITNA